MDPGFGMGKISGSGKENIRIRDKHPASTSLLQTVISTKTLEN
jgi:hypothetical protein